MDSNIFSCASATQSKSSISISTSNSITESAFLARWEADIIRASKHYTTCMGLPHMTQDDLAQEARLRLLILFRSGKSRSEPYIRRAIQNAIRKASNKEKAASIEDDAMNNLEDITALTPAEEDLLVKMATKRWITSLPQYLQILFRELYIKEHTQRLTAKNIGVSQPRIAQLHSELLARGQAQLTSPAIN